MTDQAATARIHEAMPYCATLGVRAESYTAEKVTLRDDAGRLGAKVTQTQMVLRPRG